MMGTIDVVGAFAVADGFRLLFSEDARGVNEDARGPPRDGVTRATEAFGDVAARPAAACPETNAIGLTGAIGSASSAPRAAICDSYWSTGAAYGTSSGTAGEALGAGALGG
jgi:hypothetical protein